MVRYRDWAKSKGGPYPKHIDFNEVSRNNWASPVSLYDMWKANGRDVPFIIMDTKARSGKVYSLEEIVAGFDKYERSPFACL